MLTFMLWVLRHLLCVCFFVVVFFFVLLFYYDHEKSQIKINEILNHTQTSKRLNVLFTSKLQ